MREPVSPAGEEPSSFESVRIVPRPRRSLQTPPQWARADRASIRDRGYQAAVLRTAAVLGWLLAFALVIYSHGQSDRVRTTEQDMRSRVAALSNDLSAAWKVQGFLLTPDLEVFPLSALQSPTKNAAVNLIYAPGGLSGLVVASGLSVRLTPQAYVVWGKRVDGRFTKIGMLKPHGPSGPSAIQIAAKQPIDTFLGLYVNLESDDTATQPNEPQLFGIRLAG